MLSSVFFKSQWQSNRLFSLNLANIRSVNANTLNGNIKLFNVLLFKHIHKLIDLCKSQMKSYNLGLFMWPDSALFSKTVLVKTKLCNTAVMPMGDIYEMLNEYCWILKKLLTLNIWLLNCDQKY